MPRLQCRQKTVEVKAKCKAGKCTLYFCPRCLENRYQEEVDTVRACLLYTSDAADEL